MKPLSSTRVLIFGCIPVAVLLALNGCNGGGSGAFDSSGYGPGLAGSSPSATSKPGRFTVVLAQYFDYDREQQAQQLQARARQVLQNNDVWFEYERSRLSVHYGHFQNYKTAQKELQRTRNLYSQLGLGTRNLQFCYLKEIPQPDPPAPEEWNLIHSGCAYTFEMAVFFNVPEKQYFNRKADAVEAVKNLRAEGKQAYFLHGPLSSWVYVECLPHSVQQEIEVNGRIQTTYSPFINVLRKKYQYHENGQRIFDVSRDKQGKRIRIPRLPKFIIVDELLTEMGYPR